jgi:molybdopterin converting factor subunit 1
VAIRLLFFAALRDVTGHAEFSLPLPQGVDTIAALRSWIVGRFAQLEAQLPSVRFAVNEVFVEDEHTLADGDVVALIPPVTGG